MASKTPCRLLIPLLRTSLQKPHSACLARRQLNTPSHLLCLSPPLLPRQCLYHPQKHLYSTSPSSSDPRPYTYEEIAALSSKPNPRRIIIDVREPSELQQSGRIPGAYSMPITSNPDAFYLGEEEFLERFGFEKPRASTTSAPSTAATSQSPYSNKMKQTEANSGLSFDSDGNVDSEAIDREAGGSREGEGVEEVVFYCKAGVRSRAAARMAREWQGVRVGDMKGGWMEWEGRGGRVER